MRYPLLSVLLYTLMAATPIQAAMYKWVDENGQTVYSQTPPPSGKQGAERIKAPPRPPSNTAQQKTQDNAATSGERRNEKKTQEEDKKKSQQAEANRKKHCDEMRQDIETLTTKPVVRRTGEDGESAVLTAEEREADIKVLRERLKKECK